MKDHGEFFHQIPDDYLADILPLARKAAIANGLEDGQYNLLQVCMIELVVHEMSGFLIQSSGCYRTMVPWLIR